MVGALGEVVFFAERPPVGALSAVLPDGRSVPLELLGHDGDTRLAVGRLATGPGESPPPPLRVASEPTLSPGAWVVVIRARANATEPFAGVVESVPSAGLGPSATAGRRARTARVAAPGDLGSPVLSTEGELLAVVVEGGRRGCRALPFERVVPFLRGAVLGD